MMMGPAPMIMIELISVLFGISAPLGSGCAGRGFPGARKLSWVIGIEALGARLDLRQAGGGRTGRGGIAAAVTPEIRISGVRASAVPPKGQCIMAQSPLSRSSG
ncbi:hypothetical protein STA1M1_07670 [Sinisalibacter aestuarii]|uniref:Uncharacterized protein n=1 Tax=Sinisalibacter aestuarii TaxID=2949426 RepID=A0ABQ5LQI3_9RHOB|nr:hypothetical protein STA1M1_07670 [Sinisalibacter aestuarii]